MADILMTATLYAMALAAVATRSFAHLVPFFRFGLFPAVSVGRMIVFLFDSFVSTFVFSWSGPFFLVMPVVFFAVRRLRVAWFLRASRVILRACQLLSLASYGLLLSSVAWPRPYAQENVIGELFLVDFVQLWAWTWVLATRGDISVWSFLAGPLFVISERCLVHLTPEYERGAITHVRTAGLVLLFAIPSLYHGHVRALQTTGRNVLRVDVPWAEWHPLQLQAGFQIVVAFIALCTLVPPHASTLRLFGYFALLTILSNANVAAAAVLFLS